MTAGPGGPGEGTEPSEGSRHTSGAPVDSGREPRDAAILSFATVIALMLLVYVALFDVSSTVEKIMFAAIVIGAIGAMVAVHLTSTPTRRLPHPEKVRREQRHVAMLTGALSAVLVLLVYTASFDLNSWSEWTVLGAIVLTTVGAGIAVQTRMR